MGFTPNAPRIIGLLSSTAGGIGAALPPILFELPIERLSVEAQPLCGSRLVALLFREHPQDVLAFELRQRHPPRRRSGDEVVRPPFDQRRWQVGQLDLAALT